MKPYMPMPCKIFTCLSSTLYGWYYWSRQAANAPKVRVVRISHKQITALVIIAALG